MQLPNRKLFSFQDKIKAFLCDSHSAARWHKAELCNTVKMKLENFNRFCKLGLLHKVMKHKIFQWEKQGWLQK